MPAGRTGARGVLLVVEFSDRSRDPRPPAGSTTVSRSVLDGTLVASLWLPVLLLRMASRLRFRHNQLISLDAALFAGGRHQKSSLRL